MRYLPTMGLEIHSQLATATKIFCGCSTEFGGDPNTHGCPICLGMPGVLPVLNRRVVELAMRMALRTGGVIQPRSYFARKNYFYPDLPKGYQISMFEHPLIRGGKLDLATSRGPKTIRFNRIHLEEDAGKLIHADRGDVSYFDVNRCGVPLIEIVTEPDFDTVEEVSLFLAELKDILIFSGVSNGNMFQGNIRVDANISIRPEGTTTLGTRTEIKNMNSFVNVAAAIEGEIERQIDLVESGGVVVQETLLYNADTGRTASMRSKEEAHDYRYFPEPDLVPVVVDEAWIQQVRNSLPELRGEMRARIERDYGIPAYDADILSTTPGIAAYFEAAVAAGADAKRVSNWVMGEVLRVVNERQIEITVFPVSPAKLAALVVLIDKGTVSGSMAKTVFEQMVANGGEPERIIVEQGLGQISDRGELERAVRDVIEANPGEVEKYRSGKTQVLGFFVGQVMKLTRGKGNPKEINALVQELLQ